MSEKIDWKRRKVAEDEISAVWQEYTKLETQSEFENFSSLMDEDSFWPKIVELAEFCDEILEKNNLPKAMQSVRHDGGANWWLHPKDAPPTPPNGETWRIELGYSFVVRCFPDLSDKWFAATLGFRCREAISLRDRGKCESSSFLALIFEIARLRTDWVWRRKQKHNILRGKKCGLRHRQVVRLKHLKVKTGIRLLYRKWKVLYRPGIRFRVQPILLTRMGWAPRRVPTESYGTVTRQKVETVPAKVPH